MLIESNASNLVSFSTGALPSGASTHQLIIQDGTDRSKVNAQEVRLTAGETVSVNMSGSLY